MADYNSPYTGAEIDAGIAKTDKIIEQVQVYGGVPTDEGISLLSLPVNPTTGDRTGIYDIIFNREPGAPTTGSGIFISRMYIIREDAESTGTSHVYMNATQINSQGTRYKLDQEFSATAYVHDFGSDIASETPMYIHEIWRIQDAQ